MVLKYHISPYPASTENWTIKVWEAASDGVGAEVATQTVNTPHNAAATITFNGLDKVVHIVRMYGATSGNLLHEYNAEPLADEITVYSPIYFKIGDGGANTPAAGTATYTNLAELGGLGNDDYTVFRNNYGFLFPGVHRDADPVSGSWDLIATSGGSSDVFGDNEEYIIQKKHRVTQTPVNDSVVGKWVAGFVDISANTNYASTHLRKVIRFNGAPTYTFPVGAVIPSGYAFIFQHFGSTDGPAKVAFSNASLLWAGSPKTQIDIPRYCEACFIFDGTNWNVVYMNQSTFVNAATFPAGTVLGTGRYNVGDLGAGDQAFAIVHNKNITGDYNVFISIMTNDPANYGRDNKIGYSWWHDTVGNKPNSFNITLQEISPEVQNISIVYLLIKS